MSKKKPAPALLTRVYEGRINEVGDSDALLLIDKRGVMITGDDHGGENDVGRPGIDVRYGAIFIPTPTIDEARLYAAMLYGRVRVTVEVIEEYQPAKKPEE